MSSGIEEEEAKTKAISRRNFLKGVGVGAGVVGVIALGYGLTTVVTKPPEAVAPTATVTQTVTTTKTVTPTVPTVPVPEIGYSSTIRLNVNGLDYILVVDNRWSLADVLKEIIGLTGAKVSCDRGECGTCTVLVDGVPKLSCMMLAVEADGKKITTVEGIGDFAHLHKIQKALVDNEGMQCGACIPGIVVTAKALFDKNPKPTKGEIIEALSGNLCKCGNYPFIIKSMLEAAK